MEYVLRQLPWQYMVWWSQNEKTAWRKIILVTQYIYVYTAMYWVYQCIYLVFAKPRPPKFCHAFWLLSIDYECTGTSPKHSTLYFGTGSVEKICADHEYLQTLTILIRTLIYSSYILVHTGIYAYILVHSIIQHYVLGIRLEPPCYDVLSLLHACAVHCSQHPSFLRSPWWSGLPGGACHAQTATATGWPHRRCCPAVRPLELRRHSRTGSLNPCACWMWGIVGVELPTRNNGIRGTLPTIFWTSATSTKYILVYTCMHWVYTCIYLYKLVYTTVY